MQDDTTIQPIAKKPRQSVAPGKNEADANKLVQLQPVITPAPITTNTTTITTTTTTPTPAAQPVVVKY
eukprot:UN09893